MVKIKVRKQPNLLEVDTQETPAQKKHRKIRNKHKTSRQRKHYPSDNPGHLSKNERKEAIFPGYETLRQLSKGIAEKKSKTPLCADGHNPYHSKDGRFSQGDDDGSWSSGMSDYAARRQKTEKCARGQSARKGKQQRFTKIPCGRLGRVKQKDGSPPTYYRCYDGKRVIPEENLKLPHKTGEIDLDELVIQLGRKQRQLEKLTKEIEQLKKSKCSRQMSVSQLTTALRGLALAEKGKTLTPETTKS